MAENSLWFECNAGISGDMAVAALLDAGADRGELDRALASIPAEGFSVEVKRVQKSGIDALDFDVKLDAAHENHDHDMDYLFGHEHGGGQHHDHDDRHGHEHEVCGHHHNHDDGHEHDGHHHEHHQHEHRSLDDVFGIIGATNMGDGARELARSIFGIIAAAEGKAHNLPPDKVHFHEVGAIDSIVDVIALSVCFDNLRRVYGISRVYVPYLAEGTGTVRCQHGILPIPVPAVSNIVSEHGIPLRMIPDRGEFVTPTGAAFIAAVTTDFRLPSELVVRRAGIGAGKRSYERTNILRVSIVQESPSGSGGRDGGDCIYKLESNIDDTTGEALGFVMERLMEAGARDVQYVPCYMKKNRPAYLLSVICAENDIARLEDIIFRHTTTIGIRRMRMERTVLERELLSVESAYGPAQVKKVILRDGEVRCYPEYESVAEIARRTGRAFADIYRELLGLCTDTNR